MNVPNSNAWFGVMAALDVFHLALWGLAGIISALCRLPRWGRALSIRLPLIVAVLIVLAAVLIRLPRMADSMWYDETYTAAMAAAPDMAAALAGDVHPPLYYLLARLITVIASDEWAYRLPSLIAGLIVPFVVYALASQYGRSVGVLAALLTAFSPAMVHYSAEGRYPMMLALSALLGWLAIIRGWRAVFVVAASSAALLHATGMIYAAALILLAIYRRRWWLWAMIPAGVAAGYAMFAIGQMSQIDGSFWLWAMIPTWHITDGTVLQPNIPAALLIWLAVMILTLASWREWTRDMILLGVGVPAVMFALSIVWQPVYLPRALLASAIITMIAWARLMSRSGAAQMVAAVAIVPALLIYLADEQPAPIRDVFGLCAGLPVYTTSTNMAIMALYYADQSSTWHDGNNQHQAMSMASRNALGMRFTPPELIWDDVCIVVQHSYYTSAAELDRIEHLKRWYSTSSLIIQQDAFISYEVIHASR